MTPPLSERLREAFAAEHEEGEIGGTAYEALHFLVTQNRERIAAACALAEAVDALDDDESGPKDGGYFTPRSMYEDVRDALEQYRATPSGKE